MEEKQYIERLQHIRERINILVDELWDDHANKKQFVYKSHLRKQVVSDIVSGYEKEY